VPPRSALQCATVFVMAVRPDGRNVGIVPTDFQLKTMNLVHRTVLKLTGGKIGWTTAGMPALQLTTVGRKTGELRSVMLTSPIQEGETIVIVASRGGDPQHPAWFLNLQANPDVTVSLQGKPSRPMRARVATAEERATMWPQATAAYKGYAGYQTKTTREIPLVLLEPTN
jgi:deazaflavin-dependent oxidoreductase (nitroreductase family)